MLDIHSFKRQAKFVRNGNSLAFDSFVHNCRAVFDFLDDVYAVANRIRRRWPHAQVTDHIALPKADGYRSLHVIERRDGRMVIGGVNDIAHLEQGFITEVGPPGARGAHEST